AKPTALPVFVKAIICRRDHDHVQCSGRQQAEEDHDGHRSLNLAPRLTHTQRNRNQCQASGKRENATQAYISAGYGKNGARQNASRVMTKPTVCARVAELQSSIAAGVVTLEISNRNMRVQALNERWNQLRSAVESLLSERARDMADVPGGRSGLLCQEY